MWNALLSAPLRMLVRQVTRGNPAIYSRPLGAPAARFLSASVDGGSTAKKTEPVPAEAPASAGPKEPVRTSAKQYAEDFLTVTDRLEFDLVVIGSGPAGQKAAINAAKNGKRVVVIDKGTSLGGVYVHTGTVPSKTFREAIVHFTGVKSKGFMSEYSKEIANLSMGDIMQRVITVGQWQSQVVQSQLGRNDVQIMNGAARFLDPHHIEVLSSEDTVRRRVVRAANVLISVGTKPVRPDGWSDLFDGESIFDSDQILSDRWKLPRDMIVVGGGIIGLEYASMFNTLPGTRVTVIDGRPELLSFVDADVTGALMYIMRKQGANFKLGDSVVNVERIVDPTSGRKRIHVYLSSGRRVHGDNLLYAVGRVGNVSGLGLETLGIVPNKRGLLDVDANYRTSVPHIYAAGDVIGFPALASTSMEQGREASNIMFGFKRPRGSRKEFTVLPYGIYTCPEISMVGKTENQLIQAKIPYEVGYAKFEELAKAHILNEREGFLKVMFCPDEPHTLYGAAIIGHLSTELIHIGQAVLAHEGNVHYFVEGITNAPTFSELFRIAAFDGLNRTRD
ncbi:putative soluble pyridine nucleotide transhydrogenase [Porphyridium purpureum]|uniref:NAD(P)(+) transhydrogenase (Si-specific) n=1 Tax=Porphyridium purpureum TaxID=35688 RepID=A0A5J4YX38_PORPP|nr:putative soluble pyridine nucleotide transhydrogenase [Porphyridium purpureum]|eukprot:POR6810..scf209_3